MEQEYKYIHIMSQKSIHYNKMIMDMIEEKRYDFNSKEHFFVVSNEEFWVSLSNKNNVAYEEDIFSNNLIELKNYIKRSENVILHSQHMTLLQLFKLSEYELNKIVWCVWGHDLYLNFSEYPLGLYRKLRRYLGKGYHLLRDQRISKFKAIGIGFEYDSIEIKNRYGPNMKVLSMPYGYIKNQKDMIDRIISSNSAVSYDAPIRIMIGHSAFKFLNHIEILEKLIKFKNENIIISLVLSYGDTEYANVVKEFAVKNFGLKVEILEGVLPIEDYISYLNSVNICILDYKHQSAVANIYNLIYMGKKLYLNKDGIIKLGLDLAGVETYTVDDIDNQEFNDFAKPVSLPLLNSEIFSSKFNEDIVVQKWRNSFRSLTEKGKVHHES